MNTKAYKDLVLEISRSKGEIFRVLKRKICESPDVENLISELAFELRQDQLDKVQDYLYCGYFNFNDEKLNLVAYAVTLDAEYQRQLREVETACTPYREDEKIFRNKAIRDNRKKDLIDKLEGSKRVEGSNIFRIGNKWGYYDRRIPIVMYDWLENCYRGIDYRIRIEPKGLFDKKPKQLILEIQTISPMQRWWENLNI